VLGGELWVLSKIGDAIGHEAGVLAGKPSSTTFIWKVVLVGTAARYRSPVTGRFPRGDPPPGYWK
jgi:hypothetical protein